MSILCNGLDGFCANAAEADGYCDEHHPLPRLTPETPGAARAVGPHSGPPWRQPMPCIGRDPLHYGSRQCVENRGPHSDLCARHAKLLAPHQIINGVFYVGRDADEES